MPDERNRIQNGAILCEAETLSGIVTGTKNGWRRVLKIVANAKLMEFLEETCNYHLANKNAYWKH